LNLNSKLDMHAEWKFELQVKFKFDLKRSMQIYFLVEIYIWKLNAHFDVEFKCKIGSYNQFLILKLNSNVYLEVRFKLEFPNLIKIKT
jgi:hypothetical protein